MLAWPKSKRTPLGCHLSVTRLHLRFSRSSRLPWSRCERRSSSTPSVISLGALPNVIGHSYKHVETIQITKYEFSGTAVELCFFRLSLNSAPLQVDRFHSYQTMWHRYRYPVWFFFFFSLTSDVFQCFWPVYFFVTTQGGMFLILERVVCITFSVLLSTVKQCLRLSL